MTTPTPFATALRELVEAARECGSLKLGGEQLCWGCSARVEKCCCPPNGRERRIRAALAAWESRGPMREQQELRDILHKLIGRAYRTGEGFTDALDAIELHVTGRKP